MTEIGILKLDGLAVENLLSYNDYIKKAIKEMTFLHSNVYRVYLDFFHTNSYARRMRVDSKFTHFGLGISNWHIKNEIYIATPYSYDYSESKSILNDAFYPMYPIIVDFYFKLKDIDHFTSFWEYDYKIDIDFTNIDIPFLDDMIKKTRFL